MRRWAAFASLAALAVMMACKAMPAPDAGFILDRPKAAKPAGNPFHKFWMKPCFRDDPDHLYEVVNAREPATLDLEVAIVELVPGRPVLNAVTFAFTYLVFQRGIGAVAGRTGQEEVKDQRRIGLKPW